MKIGVIADDFTGATDIAGFLVAGGLTTVQMIGVPGDDVFSDAEAVVISLKSRSNPVEEAVADSLAALDWLRAQGCQQIFQKYCSTFDSTPQGNIGPVTDALMAALETDMTVICPSLPVNGRSVYMGHLFVGQELLQNSGMRHHPITPMTDSSLIRLMEAQAKGRCGLVPAAIIDKGSEAVQQRIAALRDEGCRYAVLDTLSDAQLEILGGAVKDMPLVTGGSGLGGGIAKALGGTINESAAAGAPLDGRGVVISGSCSEMTNQQVGFYRELAPTMDVDVERCLTDAESYGAELAAWVLDQPSGRLSPMITATAPLDRLREIQSRHGKTAAEAVEHAFAAAARKLAESGIIRFVVAGGETSGAVTQALGVTGFAIGPQIAPGVPWVRAVNRDLSLALKSGNFGQREFFLECQPAAIPKEV